MLKTKEEYLNNYKKLFEVYKKYNGGFGEHSALDNFKSLINFYFDKKLLARNNGLVLIPRYEENTYKYCTESYLALKDFIFYDLIPNYHFTEQEILVLNDYIVSYLDIIKLVFNIDNLNV